jgi:hypothetical protein
MRQTRTSTCSKPLVGSLVRSFMMIAAPLLSLLAADNTSKQEQQQQL